MASIRFELEDSEHVRRQLGALGSEFVAVPAHKDEDHGKIVVLFPDVLESEALFLVVKGVTGHGMVAALDNGRKEDPRAKAAAEGHALEDFERKSAETVAAKTDKDAPRLSKAEAEKRAAEDRTAPKHEETAPVPKAANESKHKEGKK